HVPSAVGDAGEPQQESAHRVSYRRRLRPPIPSEPLADPVRTASGPVPFARVGRPEPRTARDQYPFRRASGLVEKRGSEYPDAGVF
ncbi:MAG: hypothetical protein ACYC61_24640, partial [Isosphaeraceae bacterium]